MHNIDNTGARWEPMDFQINTDEDDNIYTWYHADIFNLSFDTKFAKNVKL